MVRDLCQLHLNGRAPPLLRLSWITQVQIVQERRPCIRNPHKLGSSQKSLGNLPLLVEQFLDSSDVGGDLRLPTGN